MKKAIVIILALVGLFTLVAVAALAGVGLLAAFGTARIPAQIVLEVDFEQGVIESIPDDPLAQIMLEDLLPLRDVVDALDRATEDRRVKALFARIGSGGMGMAHLQEIRDAVMRFRESGKPAYAFAETFGEFGPGNGGYYLATAFDRIYLQPAGDVGLTGMIYESPFVRGLLDKLHVTPRLEQRMEYKNAMNFYTDEAYNEPFRTAMQALLDSQFGQLVRGIAEARNLPEQDVMALIDRGPFLGHEAVTAGLVDELVYRDEAVDRIEEAVGDAEFYDLSRYLAAAGRKNRKGTTIALIEAYGTVVRGGSRYSPLDGSVSMGADSISAAFRSAIEDRRVKAIIFRVDSPGGSYVASDTIWRETIRAQEAGKPVIVSMGNVAGSGGYFVAMNADKIVAQPGTITASIGVLGGKLLTRDFWQEMLGVTWDDVHSSENSRMWTATYDYGPSHERFAASLDRVYEDFTGRVAAGRDLPSEEVSQLARGRIWTGQDALELGLVDELGGVDVAIRLAREAIGLEPDAPVRIKRFPRRRSAWELFVSKRGERAALAALRRSLALLQPRVRMLQELGIWNDSGPLSMPRVTHHAAPALR